MSRFRVSKFRHVEAKVARKEAWIGDLQSSCPSGNPRIKANSLWIAFSTDLAGVLGTVALESPKGIKTVVSHLHCHSDVVTDFDFSPFDQQLLATGSADKAVKVWRLLEANLSASPHVMLGPHGSQVEVLLFHPTADGVLASAAGKAVKIWDVEQQQILIELEPHLNQVQSLAWKPDGSLLGTSCRDKRLHIFDPRAKPVACQTVLAHTGGKEARLLWVNTEGFFLSVGSNQMMEREVCLWDSRRLSSSLASVTLDASPSRGTEGLAEASAAKPYIGGRRVSPFPSLGDSGGWRAPSSPPSKPGGAGQDPWCLPDPVAAAAGLGGERSWLDQRPARQRQLCKHHSGLAGAELRLTLPKGGLPVRGHSGLAGLELGGCRAFSLVHVGLKGFSQAWSQLAPSLLLCLAGQRSAQESVRLSLFLSGFKAPPDYACRALCG
ncbi:coronin-7 [Crotalus adamanteus]|uniref:Coronin n=1 Tax=Crotalus adamanteus TaxID=8729 RepID=A0AAW1ATL2_CROAD